MKRTWLLIGLLLIGMVVPMMAQENKSFADRLMFEINMGAGVKQHGITPITATFNAGVNVTKRFYAFASVEGMTGLYKNGAVKTYERAANIGGGLGYNLWTNKSGSDALDLKASATTTVGGSNWKNTAYTVQLVEYLGAKNSSVKPFFGLGYRYIDSHHSAFANYGNVYVTIGLRF
ncbi:MAG: DUF481 domain-containing protein [Prevotella sp.]|nr:DUF481 domain-containing protein [Prevotella sp.]